MPYVTCHVPIPCVACTCKLGSDFCSTRILVLSALYYVILVIKDSDKKLLIFYSQLENRVADLIREKEDMEGRLEDDQDEIEELLEKQRAHISHTSSLQSQLNEATIQIGELEESKITLESRVGLVCLLM